MSDYSKLVEALRSASTVSTAWEKLMHDAAAAIEALDRLLDQNTKRCEALRKQLREAHESYERHLNELEAQLPKRGEIVRCGECKHYNAGFECLVEGYGIERDPDWFCGDGKRKVQE